MFSRGGLLEPPLMSNAPKKSLCQIGLILLLMPSRCVSYILKRINWVPILQDLWNVIPEGIPSVWNLFGPLKCSWESEVLTIVKYPKADFILGCPVLSRKFHLRYLQIQIQENIIIVNSQNLHNSRICLSKGLTI